jgi:hypothetical protein
MNSQQKQNLLKYIHDFQEKFMEKKLMGMKFMEKLCELIKYLEIVYDFIKIKLTIHFLSEMQLDMELELDLLSLN